MKYCIICKSENMFEDNFLLEDSDYFDEVTTFICANFGFIHQFKNSGYDPDMVGHRSAGKRLTNTRRS